MSKFEYNFSQSCDICNKEVRKKTIEMNLGFFGCITRDYSENFCSFKIICEKCLTKLKQEKEKNG